MKYDYNTLLLLRENVTLGLLDYFKVRGKRINALDYQYYINKMENCNLGVDFTEAFQMEFDLRLEKWKNRVMKLWIEYGGGRDLEEFALDVLSQQKRKKRILRKRY